MPNVIKRTAIFLFCLLPLLSSEAQQTKTSGMSARDLFEKVYNRVFGPEGSTLSYAVNIIGIYKTEGRIIYKEKQSQYEEARYAAWVNNDVAYMVDKKKKEVGIYRADDDEKDVYLSKFKYDVNNFTFSARTQDDYYEITAKLKDASFFGIRYVRALVEKKTLNPVSLTIKVAFFHTTVKIKDFKAGGITDASFVFPKSRFVDYKYTDHRNAPIKTKK